MALLGRSYTKPIITQNADGVRMEPTPGNVVVVTQRAGVVPKFQVSMATGPSIQTYSPAVVVLAIPQIEKKYKVFVVNQPTDTVVAPPTTTTAAAVVVTHTTFPPKVRVWTWQGDPTAAPPPLGAGPPHHCPPFTVAGTTRVTGVAGIARASGVAGVGRTSGSAGSIKIGGVAGSTRLTGGRNRQESSTGTGGSIRTTTARDAC